MKHIAFAKLGKSIKFVSAFSPTGGDNEAPSMLRILANNNPDTTFHIIGRSDFSCLGEEQRIALFPYDNVKDAFDDHTGPADQNRVINYFDELGVRPDSFVMMVGQVGNVSIPNRIWGQRDPSKTVSIINMTKNYTTPMTKWLNENTDMNVIEICNDPRYTLKQNKDCFVDPRISLSQYTYEYERGACRDYVDQTRVTNKVPAKYSEVEKIFLYDRKFEAATAKGRDTNFMIVLNEGAPSRYDILKEWILDSVDDVDIYGKWDHKETQGDSRFKGPIPINNLQRKLKNVRASFIIPILKGWATSKYIEMIHAGVVPFFHPTYDEQDNLHAPEWLRPKNPDELARATEALQDDRIYIKAIRELQSLYCKPEYYDGSRLNTIVMENIIDGYDRLDLNEFERKGVDRIDLTGFY